MGWDASASPARRRWPPVPVHPSPRPLFIALGQRGGAGRRQLPGGCEAQRPPRPRGGGDAVGRPTPGTRSRRGRPRRCRPPWAQPAGVARAPGAAAASRSEQERLLPLILSVRPSVRLSRSVSAAGCCCHRRRSPLRRSYSGPGLGELAATPPPPPPGLKCLFLVRSPPPPAQPRAPNPLRAPARGPRSAQAALLGVGGVESGGRGRGTAVC